MFSLLRSTQPDLFSLVRPVFQAGCIYSGDELMPLITLSILMIWELSTCIHALPFYSFFNVERYYLVIFIIAFLNSWNQHKLTRLPPVVVFHYDGFHFYIFSLSEQPNKPPFHINALYIFSNYRSLYPRDLHPIRKHLPSPSQLSKASIYLSRETTWGYSSSSSVPYTPYAQRDSFYTSAHLPRGGELVAVS